MRYAKVFGILFSAGMLLSSCGARDAEPFAGIDPGAYELFYYEYDGETVRDAVIAYGDHSVEDMHAEILAKMQETDAKAVEAAESKAVPVYGLEFLSFEEPRRTFAWSDGYLYADDGTVYEFDFDFPAVMAEYPLDWEGEDTELGRLPCARELVLDDLRGWETELLIPAGELSALPAPDGISAEVQRADADSVFVLVKNETEETWSFCREDIRLQVKQNGVWYDIPMLSRWERNEFSSTYEHVLAGEEFLIDVEFGSLYGDIPRGDYRMRIRDEDGTALTVEFTGECISLLADYQQQTGDGGFQPILSLYKYGSFGMVTSYFDFREDGSVNTESGDFNFVQGSYELTDRALHLVTDDGLYEYHFRRSGKKLIFDAENSVMMSDYQPEDGTVFAELRNEGGLE